MSVCLLSGMVESIGVSLIFVYVFRDIADVRLSLL